ncbi:MAG: ecdysteroid 22-kinase family protein [Polyangiaceae bacterium]|nr:ecdysteroid 22-kinase family protein [Polyangiaceae bacterium]
MELVEIEKIAQHLGASQVHTPEPLQSLWSGYGKIWRLPLDGLSFPSVIVKQINPPGGASGLESAAHPRGWGGTLSHQRKLYSYGVEMRFYEYLQQAPISRSTPARVPEPLYLKESPAGWLFVLEDLDASGFAKRTSAPSQQEVRACLRWLARFHARHMEQQPQGLWAQGNYWHLSTRPDELRAMGDSPLKAAAASIDAKLKGARFQTWIHGDAKIANFCLPEDWLQEVEEEIGVAAVDFQYVGAGAGIVDIAYFFSSIWNDEGCEKYVPEALDYYFDALVQELPQWSQADWQALEKEWRFLYPFAWADFLRFLEGWAPAHGKIHPYSQRLTAEALAKLSP